MKIAAIISSWADTRCLLPFCIENIRPVVDSVIVIYSEYSNHFNHNDAITELVFSKLPCQWVKVEPERGRSPHDNETRKRNFGLSLAKEQGCTHFIILDADEFYIQEEFEQDKQRMVRENLNGLVSKIKTYVKSPCLQVDDHTLVPSIQKLHRNTMIGNWKQYPFTVDSEGHTHIDPTRRINTTFGVEMSSFYMHHFSYVRDNIDLKIDNSSANLRRSREVIYQEMIDAKPGYKSKLYHRELKECPNYFNLPRL